MAKKERIKSYSEILRKYINDQIYLNSKTNPTTFGWKVRDDYKELLAYNTIKAMQAVSTTNQISDTAMDSYSETMRLNKLMMTMGLLTVYVDMYKILNLREKLDIINSLDASLLEKMRNAKDFSSIYAILLNPANLALVVQALNFSNLSIYDKVLQIKALDEEDLAFIEKIFEPFGISFGEGTDKLYQSEYEAYNVEVDEAFMIRQMKKWKDTWKNNPEKSYEDAANFLDQYTILNNSLYKSLVSKTGHTKLNDTKGMLKKLINQ